MPPYCVVYSSEFDPFGLVPEETRAKLQLATAEIAAALPGLAVEQFWPGSGPTSLRLDLEEWTFHYSVDVQRREVRVERAVAVGEESQVREALRTRAAMQEISREQAAALKRPR